MPFRHLAFASILAVLPTFATLDGAALDRQQADVFAKKIAVIAQQGEAGRPGQARRTPVSESEVNSWFAYRAQPVLPQGVSAPQVTILGQGRVAGQATVNLDAIAKRRGSGGTLDPWSYIGGNVPVNVTGILHTKDGKGRFEMQTAEISGIPVPKTILQEMVSYYSRTAENPTGVRLDDTFELPANIREIQVGQGQAVVVQ